MPTYDYVCPVDGHETSITTTIAEYVELSDDVLCPQRHAMNRVYSTPSFTIQGLASDRFKYKDKIAANRQAVVEKGMPT